MTQGGSKPAIPPMTGIRSPACQRAVEQILQQLQKPRQPSTSAPGAADAEEQA
jgi:hypothetical protein